MIKLIITDLDGTLLDSNKQLPSGFWEIEKQLTSTGILFSVASGRQYYNLVEKFDCIRDSLLIIAENGTFVKYNDQEIGVNPMDKPSAIRLIEIGRKIPGAYLIVCGRRSAYVENANEAFLKEARTYYRNLEIINDLTLVDDTILKVTLCDFNNAEHNSYPHFQYLEKEYKIAVSGDIWLDISNITANKGTAIQKVQQQFGISYSETMVFGDFLNDLEMMKVAKYSFAMKNAHPDILSAANYITEFDNDHHGVLKTIQKYCLDKIALTS
jgi:Cof subfamily protein (haloacid dehalogenase superfamily)